MRTLLVLVVSFVLLMETLQAAVPKPAEERKLTVNRRLLSDGNFGAKADSDGSDTKSSPAKNDTGNSETEPGKDDDDKDNINHSQWSYGNPAGSTTGNHHDFYGRKPVSRAPIKERDD